MFQEQSSYIQLSSFDCGVKRRHAILARRWRVDICSSLYDVLDELYWHLFTAAGCRKWR